MCHIVARWLVVSAMEESCQLNVLIRQGESQIAESILHLLCILKSEGRFRAINTESIWISLEIVWKCLHFVIGITFSFLSVNIKWAIRIAKSCSKNLVTIVIVMYVKWTLKFTVIELEWIISDSHHYPYMVICSISIYAYILTVVPKLCIYSKCKNFHPTISQVGLINIIWEGNNQERPELLQWWDNQWLVTVCYLHLKRRRIGHAVSSSAGCRERKEICCHCGQTSRQWQP